jgi:hypothetical protein
MAHLGRAGLLENLLYVVNATTGGANQLNHSVKRVAIKPLCKSLNNLNTTRKGLLGLCNGFQIRAARRI